MDRIFQQFDMWAAIDVAIISVIVYQLLMLLKGTRSAQVLTGIVLITFAFILSNIVPLTSLNWIMSKFYSSFILIIIILFQDDIRRMLSTMGRRSILTSNEIISSKKLIEEIIKASTRMADKRVGALIVIERNITLQRYIDLGTILDCVVSREILESIFQVSTPLHDGAIIIRGRHLAAAGCFLPLSRREDIDPNFGTRHRAAIGISHESDAIVIIVSEEKGKVSYAKDGNIFTGIQPETLRAVLKRNLLADSEAAAEKTTFWSKWFKRENN